MQTAQPNQLVSHLETSFAFCQFVHIWRPNISYNTHFNCIIGIGRNEQPLSKWIEKRMPSKRFQLFQSDEKSAFYNGSHAFPGLPDAMRHKIEIKFDRFDRSYVRHINCVRNISNDSKVNNNFIRYVWKVNLIQNGEASTSKG